MTRRTDDETIGGVPLEFFRRQLYLEFENARLRRLIEGLRRKTAGRTERRGGSPRGSKLRRRGEK